MDDRALAALQADLIAWLHAGMELEELRARVRSEHGEPWASWVDGFDPRAVHVAHLIVARWGRRKAVG